MLTQQDKARALAGRFDGNGGEEFSPGGVPISQIAEEYGSPFYLYHGEQLLDRVRRVREALGEGVEVSYSVKANPSVAVCQLLSRGGAGGEVASSGELAVVRAAGIEPNDIVFAGPGKTNDELRRAVNEEIFAVNVESLGEIERLSAIAEEEGKQVGVGLRINPAAQLMGSQMRMGGTVGQFGIDQEDLEEAVRKVLSYPQLILRGIHIYTATQVFDADALLEHCRNIFEVALECADYAGRPLEMIDFGGGFGVPYFEKMEDFDLERFGAGYRDLLPVYRSDPRLEGCRFMLRTRSLPGRRRGALRYPRSGREGHAGQDIRRHRRRYEPPPHRDRQYGPGIPQSVSTNEFEPSRRGAGRGRYGGRRARCCTAAWTCSGPTSRSQSLK